MMAQDWARSKTDAEKAVMIRRARIGRVISIFCITMITVLIILTLVLPRFGITIGYVTNGTDVRKTFITPAYYVIDVYRSPYFEMLLATEFILLYLMAMSYSGVDNFLAVLIFHVCGQLENLRVRVTNIKESKNFDHVLTTIVEDHVQLIRYFL